MINVVKNNNNIKLLIIRIGIMINLIVMMISVFIPQYYRFKVEMSVSMLVMILIVFLYRKNAIKPKLNTKLILMIIIGISFAFFGLKYHFIGYVCIGFTTMILVPAIGLIVTNTKEMYTAITKGFCDSMIILCVLSVSIGPSIKLDQYCSIFGNPNTLANFAIAYAVCSLYIIISTNKRRWLYTICFGISGAFLLFSESRTGGISFIAILLITLIYSYICSTDRKKWLISVCVVFMTFIISVPSVFIILKDVNPVVHSGISRIISIGNHDEKNQVDFNGIIDRSLDRSMKGITDNSNFTSGRLEIWEDYVKHVALFGHSKEERNVRISYREYSNTNAHNSILQVAYSAGILAGIALLLLLIILLIDKLKGLRYFISNKNDDEVFLCSSMCLIVFITFGMLSYTFISGTSPVSLLFWLIIAPCLIGTGKTNN